MLIIKTPFCLQMYCCLWKDASACSEYTYFTTVSPVKPCFAMSVSNKQKFGIKFYVII